MKWHTTEYLQPTVALLDAAGYTNVCVQLPSVGADPPLLSADDDVATIRKALVEILDKKEQMVVIIMHSYGGIPGTSGKLHDPAGARDLPRHDLPYHPCRGIENLLLDLEV